MRLNKFYITIFCFLMSSLFAQETSQTHEVNRIHEYLQFIQAYDDYLGPVGDYTQGEIEILLDANEIQQVENDYKKKLIKRGVNEDVAEKWSRVGFFEGDSNWIWIRDAVILPSGRKTIKGRFSWKTSIDGPEGVATLPLLKDKRIVVCLKYKHAMRAWQIELPRGTRLYGESAVDAAKRELRNETGFLAESHLFLGSIAADSSSLNTLTPLFLGYINAQAEPVSDDERGVLGFLILSKDEIKNAFLKGNIKLKLYGKVRKVAMNDANLSFAILQAEMRGLI